MTHHTLTLAGEVFDHPLQKIVCVGRNYAEHAKEMGSDVLEQPMLFIKPATSAQPFSDACMASSRGYDVHYELELAVLVGAKLKEASVETAAAAIAGVGLGLDLTLRDLQRELKANGHPWEAAKGFDGSCPLSDFAKFDPSTMQFEHFALTLKVNNEVRQHGKCSDMVFSVPDLLSYASKMFTLMPGDVVLTGTPAGVGKFVTGDQIRGQLLHLGEQILAVQSSVE